MNFDIDIVVPWVDGGDPKWQEEKKKYKPSYGSDDNINRYRDWGLLPYWFRAVEKYAPWIRRIHFVTWGHIPPWLNTENEKLHIVKHIDFIPEQYLPVFSCNPIELNMHRIEGLAEHFIYANDDFLFNAPCSPEDYFKDGKPVDIAMEIPFRFMCGQIDHIAGNNMFIINKHFNKKEVELGNKNIWFSPKAPKAALKNLYMLPCIGFSAFYNPHTMQPFLKSTLEEVWQAEGEKLTETCYNRFRTGEDVTQWLFRYWQMVTGKIVQSEKPRGKFFSIGRDNKLIEDAILGHTYKDICLSDDDVNYDFEKEQSFLISLLSQTLPEKSQYEK